MTVGVFGTRSALLFLLRFWVVLPFIMIYPLWHQALLALGIGRECSYTAIQQQTDWNYYHYCT